LAALEPKFWAEFCRRVERPDLIARHFPVDDADRQRTMAELAALFRTRPRDEWVAALGDVDVCLGPVNTLTEALADPPLRARGIANSADYGAEGEGGVLRTAPLISDAPFVVRLGLPGLGAHTREALEAAGYSAGEIATLADEGAIALGE
jgi:crotonobetainyl-CoA:carnitine CoA-transferase CaiB-like acyl-CoA transferase